MRLCGKGPRGLLARTSDVSYSRDGNWQRNPKLRDNLAYLRPEFLKVFALRSPPACNCLSASNALHGERSPVPWKSSPGCRHFLFVFDPLPSPGRNANWGTAAEEFQGQKNAESGHRLSFRGRCFRSAGIERYPQTAFNNGCPKSLKVAGGGPRRRGWKTCAKNRWRGGGLVWRESCAAGSKSLRS